MKKFEKRKESIEKIISALKDQYTRISSAIKGILDTNGTDKKPAGTSPNGKLKDLLERLGRPEKHLDDAFIPQEMQEDFHSHVQRMAMEGFNDGVIGLRSESNHEFSKAKAEDLYLRYTAILAEKQKKLSREMESKTRVLDDKSKHLKLHHDYQDFLQHHYKFSERGNTIWEFIIYLVFYLVIFFADIPLAAEMLRWLFDVNITDRPISLDTIGQNSNAILTAFGLAMSTIYIKHTYDEFIGKKYGNSVLSKKKFEDLFRNENSRRPELDEKEKKKILANSRAVGIFKIILLLFTLATVTVLGIFRGFAWLQKNEQGDIPVFLISLTLISITLLFSVMSGVCLSLSLNALTNYRRMKDCKKEAIKLEKAFLGTTDDLAILEGKKVYAEKAAEKMEDGLTWKNNLALLLTSYYDKGFKEGYSEPGYFMQQLDFFDRVLLWREQAIAAKINANINK